MSTWSSSSRVERVIRAAAEPQLYFRRDDPVEKVKITSQERTPNGKITVEIVEPKESAGRTHTFQTSAEFRIVYEKVEDPVNALKAPTRPSSFGTKDEWRKYALHLEKRLGLYKEPVMRGLAEAHCNRCYVTCGAHAIGESCSNNDGGKIVAGPSPALATP